MKSDTKNIWIFIIFKKKTGNCKRRNVCQLVWPPCESQFTVINCMALYIFHSLVINLLRSNANCNKIRRYFTQTLILHRVTFLLYTRSTMFYTTGCVFLSQVWSVMNGTTYITKKMSRFFSDGNVGSSVELRNGSTNVDVDTNWPEAISLRRSVVRISPGYSLACSRWIICSVE